MYCNFEIFHMLEKQIPVDSVEVILRNVRIGNEDFKGREKGEEGMGEITQKNALKTQGGGP